MQYEQKRVINSLRSVKNLNFISLILFSHIQFQQYIPISTNIASLPHTIKFISPYICSPRVCYSTIRVCIQLLELLLLSNLSNYYCLLNIRWIRSLFAKKGHDSFLQTVGRDSPDSQGPESNRTISGPISNQGPKKRKNVTMSLTVMLDSTYFQRFM